MPERTVRFIACATVVEELRPRLPAGTTCETLDFGLHTRPEKLKAALQAAIDASKGYEVIVLGYGLCSMAVIGLQSETSTLVVPKVDDCISIFLGSRKAYLDQIGQQPGTYYLTKGWIEVGDTPFSDFERTVEKYGSERARRIMAAYFRHYTRLAFINTGEHNLDKYRSYTQEIAARFGLNYEEIPGSSALIEKMIDGPWDNEFVVVPPGRAISYFDFVTRVSES